MKMKNNISLISILSRSSMRVMLIISVLSALIMSGCDLSLLGFRDTTKGVLTISVNSSRFVSSRSVLPETDMAPVEYHISGSGPSAGTFESITNGGSESFFDLAIGSWTVTVTAYNAAGQQIGWGESIAFITASTETETSVLVEPYTGKGSLDLSVSWIAADVTDPSISAVLTDNAGTQTSLPFDLGSGEATYTDIDVPSGYYTLNIQLLESGNVVSGLVESVRVIQDFQTTGDFNFEDLNNPSGDISISVIVNMYDPLLPAINGAASTLTYGSDMTVSASVPNADGETLIYKWFANGDLVGSTETLTFGSSLRWGNYRLDLVVTNVEGSRSGSATHSFIVE